jgi:hypothetical protein
MVITGNNSNGLAAYPAKQLGRNNKSGESTAADPDKNTFHFRVITHSADFYLLTPQHLKKQLTRYPDTDRLFNRGGSYPSSFS